MPFGPITMRLQCHCRSACVASAAHEHYWGPLFSFVDLFAGCGGLSLGLRRAGGVEVFAVEKAPGAARTYYRNILKGRDREFPAHVELSTTDQARIGLVVKPVAEVLDVIEDLQIGELDLVAGGPPCQGFSLAGRRDRHDARNELVWEFLEFVALTRPKVVIIENVVGMGRKFGTDDESSTFSDVQEALASTGAGYVVNGLNLNAMHYGAPQHRPRLMIIGVRKDLARERRGGSYWESRFLDDASEIPWFAPRPIRAEDRTHLGHALDGILSPEPNPSEYSKILSDASAWGLEPRPDHPLNHELRKHRPTTIYRFQFAQLLAARGLSVRVLGPMSSEASQREMDKVDRLFAASPDDVWVAGGSRFSTPDEVKMEIARLRNKKHSQRVLQRGRPSHTVVTIPDDYIHPDTPRTFTVRELARIQGFPDDFEFMGKATTGGTDRRTSVPQYSQVGNAVSPLVGFSLGTLVSTLLTS